MPLFGRNKGFLHIPLLLILAVAILGGIYAVVKFRPEKDRVGEFFVSAKPNTNIFSNMSAEFKKDSALFNFVFSEPGGPYTIEVSTYSKMNRDVYRDFGTGQASPILVNSADTKWDKYRCGTTIYWTVSLATNSRYRSNIQKAIVDCSLPTATPTPSPASPTPTATPAPTPVSRTSYWVKPYLVYPADKPMYPEYEAAVKTYMTELQNWYKEKVGATFYMQPLVVVRSQYSYDTMRCDSNPSDSTPPSSECLSDPKRMDGNWGMYMNLAVNNGVEKWSEQSATLVFSAGGGGYAGANKYPNDTGWAITGDWVLEPISGKANDWGIPCKYSDGWQCSGGVPKGTPAHELGHAFGLGHPDPALYPEPSIMKWHGGYPTAGFLSYEVDFLLQSPFFK